MLERLIGKDTRQDDELARRLLEAASARAGELPALSPFFLTRVKAAVLSAGRQSEAHPFGAAARQMLPALALLVAILSGWAGYQTVEADRAREAVFARLAQAGAAQDLLLASLILGPAPPGAP